MSETPLPSSFDKEFFEESRWQKFSRRLIEEPLIPIGCGATCWALYQATKSIRVGDHNRTNRMFRQRIYAQAFTLVAMYAGSLYYQKDRSKRKEYDDMVAEKKAKEKKEAWIKELEARDREEQEEMAIKQATRRKVGEKAVAGGKAAAGEEAAAGVAKCVVETAERGRLGVLEAVMELVRSKR